MLVALFNPNSNFELSRAASLLLLFGGNRLDQPLHAVREAFLGEGRAGLDSPSTVRDLLELQSLHHLVRLQGEIQILFVRVHEQGNLCEVFLPKERRKLLCALFKAHVIGGIDYVDEPVGVFEVVLPVGTDFTLATDIPYIQFETVLGLQTSSRAVKAKIHKV